MEKHCTRVYFLLKKNRTLKDGTSSIMASICANGERTYFMTGKSVRMEDWNTAKHCVRETCPNAEEINTFLNKLERRIVEKETELMGRGFSITPELLKDAVFDRVSALQK